MQSNAARAIVGIVAVAILVVGFVVIRDDSGDGTTQTTQKTQTGPDVASSGPVQGGGNSNSDGKSKGGAASASGGAKVPTITVTDGQPEGGVADLTFQQGDEIDFRVDSDTASGVHLHGYDVMMDVEAGGQVEFKVPADIEGIFEVELEDTKTQIAEITVNPS